MRQPRLAGRGGRLVALAHGRTTYLRGVTMTTQTKTAPLALHVPEAFTYVDRGLSRASDWVEYIVQPGLYRIRFIDINHRTVEGNTREEAIAAADRRAAASSYPIDVTQIRPYYGDARLSAVRVRSYYENQVFSAVSGHLNQHDDEPATIMWQPYAYDVRPGVGAYREWVGEGEARRLVTHATVVELQPCAECDADAGERCEEGCSGGWDGLVAANAGSAS